MTTHRVTCKLHHACLYSPAAEHHRHLACTHFTVPRRVESWVDLGGWLHTEIKCRLWESNLDTVTHLSTNRAQRRLTSLIETNVLPLRQTVMLLQPYNRSDVVSRKSPASCATDYCRWVGDISYDSGRRTLELPSLSDRRHKQCGSQFKQIVGDEFHVLHEIRFIFTRLCNKSFLRETVQN